MTSRNSTTFPFCEGTMKVKEEKERKKKKGVSIMRLFLQDPARYTVEACYDIFKGND